MGETFQGEKSYYVKSRRKFQYDGCSYFLNLWSRPILCEIISIRLSFSSSAIRLVCGSVFLEPIYMFFWNVERYFITMIRKVKEPYFWGKLPFFLKSGQNGPKWNLLSFFWEFILSFFFQNESQNNLSVFFLKLFAGFSYFLY